MIGLLLLGAACDRPDPGNVTTQNTAELSTTVKTAVARKLSPDEVRSHLAAAGVASPIAARPRRDARWRGASPVTLSVMAPSSQAGKTLR